MDISTLFFPVSVALAAPSGHPPAKRRADYALRTAELTKRGGRAGNSSFPCLANAII